MLIIRLLFVVEVHFVVLFFFNIVGPNFLGQLWVGGSNPYPSESIVASLDKTLQPHCLVFNVTGWSVVVGVADWLPFFRQSAPEQLWVHM